jgi:hypothetical protein
MQEQVDYPVGDGIKTEGVPLKAEEGEAQRPVQTAIVEIPPVTLQEQRGRIRTRFIEASLEQQHVVAEELVGQRRREGRDSDREDDQRSNVTALPLSCGVVLA